MKNRYQERLRQLAKVYHRNNSLGVDSSGLYTHHMFETELQLSWWQDFGFNLNNRQVMVWWQHPRQKYRNAIDDEVWKAVGEMPNNGDDFFAADPDYKRVGRSRKKITGHISRPTPKLLDEFYDRVNALHEQFEATGIEHIVAPSFQVKQYSWCTGVDLCVPLEIRTHADGVALIALARKLLTRQTTCALEFVGYEYGQRDWLGEDTARSEDSVRRRIADEVASIR
jgi:hypothetical protein